MDFSTAIGNTKTEDDETSHKTIVAEVTSVCDDHGHFQKGEEVIKAENHIVWLSVMGGERWWNPHRERI